MSEQRTPGEWKLDIQPNQFHKDGYLALICGNYKGPDGDTIAQLTTSFYPGGREMTREEVLANGNLMAAAPRMLAALQLTVRYLEHPDVQAMPFALSASVPLTRAREAIEAATA